MPLPFLPRRGRSVESAFTNHSLFYVFVVVVVVVESVSFPFLFFAFLLSLSVFVQSSSSFYSILSLVLTLCCSFETLLCSLSFFHPSVFYFLFFSLLLLA